MNNILFPLFSLVYSYSFSQQEIIKDTLHFSYDGKRLSVIHTTNRQYYAEPPCVWEVTYPEVFGISNRITSSSVNLMFAKEVAFGDCTEESCDLTTMYFPQLSKYWNKIRVVYIKNDFISYFHSEGHCPSYSNLCFTKITYKIYDLKTGEDVEPASLFKKDETTQNKIDSIVLAWLDFVPEDKTILRSARQYYFENGKIFAFYDVYTIGKNKTYSIALPYAEVKELLNSKGTLSRYFL